MIKEKYFHSDSLCIKEIRVITDSNGNILYHEDDDQKFIRYVPRYTVCSLWDTENNTLSFGVAVCSSKDTFVKKKGNEIAYNYALTKPYKVINNVDSIEKVKRVTAFLLNRIYSDYHEKYQ